MFSFQFQSVIVTERPAVECGMLTSLADATERTVIEGKPFRALSDSEREEIADSISVESSYYGILILVLLS
ncbi:P-type Ca(2+) transporter [Trifolium repens]|jgi:hypothetical protein|nr:P-type Ca(2+) transporter [Trifolium repens]